jgi:hypothetical protein
VYVEGTGTQQGVQNQEYSHNLKDSQSEKSELSQLTHQEWLIVQDRTDYSDNTN